ncbi:hypothetical protein DM860_000909 [Cuscuta australis]|uniref:SWIM-type domain-containing protein n=1 Tax=Cuscuta australis TaxID=267555 RepID=A0A328DW33_9ASTE|nr:hypothetical protein DM860_000909 [Cuscuta australis]
MSWENIRQEIQSHYTADGYGIISKISGKIPYSVPGISSMKLMGIDSDRLWEIFFQKAIPLGLLEVYIDSACAGGDEAGPSRRDYRVRLQGETIADEVIDNPDSDDDEEYIPSDDDIDTEEHWIHEMEAEAGVRGISGGVSDGPLAIELQTGLIMKRFCLRHVRSNFMTKFRNSDLKNLLWAAGSTHNIQQFEGYMAEIRNMSEEGYQYLNDIPRAAWTLCFDGGFRCGILTTNSSKSFNNMLKGCRMLPVTAILSMSYAKMVELFAKRYKLGIQWQEQSMHITPKIKNVLLNREKTKHKWTVSSYGNNQYVVTHTSRTDPSSIYNYLVNLFNSVCTCGQWTSDNIPCVHVHAVYHSFRQQVPHNILPARYSVQNYLSCYSGIIQPVLFPQNLDVGNFKVLQPKRPTDEIPRSGRRQRNRYQGEMDFRARR